jgi:hypothetical protein
MDQHVLFDLDDHLLSLTPATIQAKIDEHRKQLMLWEALLKVVEQLSAVSEPESEPKTNGHTLSQPLSSGPRQNEPQLKQLAYELLLQRNEPMTTREVTDALKPIRRGTREASVSTVLSENFQLFRKIEFTRPHQYVAIPNGNEKKVGDSRNGEAVVESGSAG